MIALLVWLLRRHPEVASVEVTRWQDVHGMHVEQHEAAFAEVWQ